MEKWNGKICLITGASTGIGADLCVRLANLGIVVVGLARRVEKIEELSQKVDSKSFGKIYGRKCDVQIETEILEAFKWIEEKFGKIDIFINNAGIFVSKFLVESESDNFRKLFDVNVIGACICLREAVGIMRKNSLNGHIIVINRWRLYQILTNSNLTLIFLTNFVKISILGHRIPDTTYPAFGVYPATKHALTALNQTVRQEISFLKAPIKLTSISPGMVDTDILTALNEEVVSRLPKLSVSDVSDAVIYALSTPNSVRVSPYSLPM